MLRSFNRRQWLTIVVFAVADFCSAVCVSLQAPFYPREAENKGASATEYGLVFGVFELTVFLVSPILGKNLARLGAKRVFNVGILTTGSCSVIFGLLDRIDNGRTFIAASILVRSIEAVGNSGFLTASFTIIAKEFPDNVAMMFASLETFFGIGLIVGPSVGGALYQAGGYSLPFAVLGSILILVALVTFFVLPHNFEEDDVVHSRPGGEGQQQQQQMGMRDALKRPAIAMAVYSIVCASISIGFIQATLEPHLRQFNLSPIMMGVMFVINGGVYAGSAPVWGLLCDKKLPGKLVTVFGACLISLAFLFMGPVPFIPLPTFYWVCVASLVVHAVGFAAQLVAGFSVGHREALVNGFPDTLHTYALISGLWTSAFAFGAFLGPMVAGILVDKFGFKCASLFVVASQWSVLLLFLAFALQKAALARKAARMGYEPIADVEPEKRGPVSRRRHSSMHFQGRRGGGGGGRDGDGTEMGKSVPLRFPDQLKAGHGSFSAAMSTPLESLTAGTIGVSLAVEYEKNCREAEDALQPPTDLLHHKPPHSAAASSTHEDPDTITVTAIIEGSRSQSGWEAVIS